MKISTTMAAVLLVASPLSAQFTNGGFETGTAAGWTTGGGVRTGLTNAALNPADFLPGGARYQASARSAVVGQGVMANTDGNLNQVYSGNNSYRIEDLFNGGYASVISQRVNGYTQNSIFFAWAAVLEGAHDVNTSAAFKLLLRNETTGQILINRTYTAASNGGGVDDRFALSQTGYYYTKTWQIEQLDVSEFIGNDFSLILLAADCQPAGHEGQVYLDGFGAVAPPPVDPGVVPEPSTYALMATGLAGLFGIARRRRTVAEV
ncbi:MAG: PEP-CTERM sorting domain-containing protein [Gemmatimonadaceae bacterium]|nr:PEP-CTERM sorting domain-containing protein [Gemmatimonadaceae bacterium]